MGRLHEAARNPAAKIDSLLDGVDVDERDGMSYTALHYAARAGNHNAAMVLLDAGAEIDATNKKGQTALYHSVVALEVSMTQLLIDRRADVNVQMISGFTPLHMAARDGAADITRLLLQAGADFKVENADGKTALTLAQKAGQDSIVRLLEHFAATGRVDPPTPGASADDAELLAELDALEVKPAVKYSPGSQVPPGAGASGSLAPDGYGVVQTWGKNGAPPPSMMKLHTGKGATAMRQKFTGELPEGAKPAPQTKSTTAPVATPTETPVAKKTVRAPRNRSLPPSDHTAPEPTENALPGAQSAGTSAYQVSVTSTADQNSNSETAEYIPPAEQSLPDIVEPDYDNADANPPIDAIPQADTEVNYDNADANPLTEHVIPSCIEPEYSIPDAKIPVEAALPDSSEPDYAEVLPDVPDESGSEGELLDFLAKLGLTKCADLCDDAGIDEVTDFKLFTEAELVSDHGFKVGHARKIMKAL